MATDFVVTRSGGDQEVISTRDGRSGPTGAQGRSVTVGDVEIVPILDGHMCLPYRRLFSGGEPSCVDGDAMLSLALGGYLLKIGQDRILVDAGAGPPREMTRDPAWMRSMTRLLTEQGLDRDEVAREIADLEHVSIEHGSLLTELAKAGVQPEDVTHVVISHMHFDHIGWLSDGSRASFPSARIWANGKDVEWFLNTDGSRAERYVKLVHGAIPAGDRLGPVMRQLNVWDGDCVVRDGVELEVMPGHTPGSAVVKVASNGEHALLLGDVMHSPQQISSPQLKARSDLDPTRATQSRNTVIECSLTSRAIVGAAHFPGLNLGFVTRTPSGAAAFEPLAHRPAAVVVDGR